MPSRKKTENLSFVSRQLASLLDRLSIDDALRRLADECPPGYAEDINRLHGLLVATDYRGASTDPSEFAAISNLLKANSGDRVKIFRQYIDYTQRSKIIFDTYWAGLVDIIGYLAALSAVALASAIFFGFFVMPSFNSFFSGYGALLPEFTRYVFGIGKIGVPIMATGLILIIGLSAWTTITFRKRTRRSLPLPRWPAKLPLLGKIVTAYNLDLFLNFLRILLASGVSKNEAVLVAASNSNQSAGMDFNDLLSIRESSSTGSALTEIAAAARLDQLEGELTHQCDAHSARLTMAMVESRNRFSLLLKATLYAYFASLIIAMYLPIFKLGSLI